MFPNLRCENYLLTDVCCHRLRDLLAFSQFIGIDGVDMLPAIDAELQVLSARLAQGTPGHAERYDFDMSVVDGAPSRGEIYSGGLAAPVTGYIPEDPTAWTVAALNMLETPASEMVWISHIPSISTELASSDDVPTIPLPGREAQQRPDTSQWERWIQPVGST